MNTSCRNSLSILIVDDWPDAAESLAELLVLLGHEVQLAHDGEQAIAAAQARRPEVVLLDLGLPKINGFEVAERLQALPGPMPLLVAISGYGEPRDRERGRRAGFEHFFVKPVELDDLMEVLDAHAARRAAPATMAG